MLTNAKNLFTRRLQPDPIFYHSPKDNKDYILFIPGSRGNQNCYKYDIANNKFIDWVKHPKEFKPSAHGLILNPFKNCLYIFEGIKFAKLNLNNDKWEVITTNLIKELSFPFACFIDNNYIKEMHLYFNGHHIKFDINKQQLVEIAFIE